tara:strand:- start:228 stop:587 length:360 start_codon:yes stop_codon:yes gene_type:complete
MKNELEEFNYIKVRDSVEFRKDTLECLKGVIQLLQRYGQIGTIRKEKIEKIIELKGVIKELTKLNSQLKLELPRVKISSKEVVSGSSSGTEIIRTKGTSQLEMLEDELEDIESKLKALV